jgi:hypothetical protein
MTVAGGFRFNKQDVDLFVRLLREGDAAFLETVRSEWTKAGLGFIGVIQRKYMTGRPGLKIGTGALRNQTWFPYAKVEGNDVRAGIEASGPGKRYARVHEYGATIRPIRATSLRFVVTEKVYASSIKTKKVREIKGARTENVVFAKQVKIPQRTRIREELHLSGFQLYVRGVKNALQVYRGKPAGKAAG